ncbi:MAG TPA: Do family serine endopeptidase [Candidatus Krumholzibacteria bacterium]|nr:Do family serine endopeptidase [Candidatus Krumholzibacteria bacterium]
MKFARISALLVAMSCVAATGFAAGGPAADTGLPIRADGSSITADVAEKVGPAVVFIRTERTVDSKTDGDTPFDFFREFFPQQDNDPHQRMRRMPGGGSGFVFDDENRILTNYHVIKDADKITVVHEEDGEEQEYEAHVVGDDPHSDIAIIQVDKKAKLPKVALGDSDKMRVGDWVMAIGTPFGQLQGTVTVGIVSAKGRNDLNIMGGSATYQNYIQTDASINFGNSGGPLVNMKGEAIGINTAINPSGQGIGFAIPINMAKRIMGELIAKGKVRYGYLGIRLQELDNTLAQGMGLPVNRGILVEDVYPDTPASKAGIARRDVIVKYDGQVVKEDSKFRMMVGSTPVGKTVPVVVMRDGKEKSLNVTLAERPEEDVLASTPTPETSAWLGLHVEDARGAAARREYGLDRGQSGVVITGVDQGSPADDANLQEGDIITEVYTQSVSGLDDYVAISKKLKDRKDPIAFLVKRGKTTNYVTVAPAHE